MLIGLEVPTPWAAQPGVPLENDKLCNEPQDDDGVGNRHAGDKDFRGLHCQTGAVKRPRSRQQSWDSWVMA